MPKNSVSKITSKLNSDRLWVLVAYLVLIVLNTKLQLGLSEEAVKGIGYVVIAFLIGKSIRGTDALSLISTVFPEKKDSERTDK